MVVSLVMVAVVVLELLYRLYFVVASAMSCCFCCCGCFVEFWRLFVLSGGCFVLRSYLLLFLLAEYGTAGCFLLLVKKKIDRISPIFGPSPTSHISISTTITIAIT